MQYSLLRCDIAGRTHCKAFGKGVDRDPIIIGNAVVVRSTLCRPRLHGVPNKADIVANPVVKPARCDQLPLCGHESSAATRTWKSIGRGRSFELSGCSNLGLDRGKTCRPS